eukprot:GHVO01001224.1.p1 GENE.GHVO01001224.1~~GHVO01001224.1.p1  ORF type:complete len:270 (+),score=50.99 GHVO01001224.1:561-1370(+)
MDSGGFWHEIANTVKRQREETLSNIKHKQKEDERMKTVFDKLDQAEQKLKQSYRRPSSSYKSGNGKSEKGNAKAKSVKTKRRRYEYSSDEESSYCSGEEDEKLQDENNEEDGEYEIRSSRRRHDRPKKSRSRQHNPAATTHDATADVVQPPSFSRTNQKKKKGGLDDFLPLGKEVAPFFSGDNSRQIYNCVRNRYKRSIKTTLKNMMSESGSLHALLTEEEKQALQKRKPLVDKMLENDDDLSVNPFDGDMNEVGNMVVNVLQEVHHGN